MSGRFLLVSGVALAALMATGVAADARHYRHRAPRYVGPQYDEMLSPRGEVARSTVCTPICLGDNHPCDPIQFKQFDGRCGVRW